MERYYLTQDILFFHLSLSRIQSSIQICVEKQKLDWNCQDIEFLLTIAIISIYFVLQFVSCLFFSWYFLSYRLILVRGMISHVGLYSKTCTEQCFFSTETIFSCWICFDWDIPSPCDALPYLKSGALKQSSSFSIPFHFSGLKGQGHGSAHAHWLNHLSNLLLILLVNKATHKYLSDLRVYLKVEVYFRNTWSRMEEY